MRLPVNAGPSAARNAGARWAETDLIAFLDDDDTYLDGALDRLRAAFERAADDPCAFVFARRRHVDLGGNVVGEDTFQPVDAVGDRAGKHHSLQLVRCASSCAWVFDRAAFLELGGFDEELFVSEDRDLLFRLLQSKMRVVGLDTVCVVYLQGTDALSSVDDPRRKLESDARVLDKHLDWLRGRRELAAIHLNRLASRQRHLGDMDAARKTLKLLCAIDPTNLRAWRRRLTW